ncbi:hypothetical protein BKA82DRAFT_4018399 [Pisolithus tinctorius]|nr:hypothetical protein BKA82DRAFT_4018399 [Pisolithus tinctorius]
MCAMVVNQEPQKMSSVHQENSKEDAITKTEGIYTINVNLQRLQTPKGAKPSTLVDNCAKWSSKTLYKAGTDPLVPHLDVHGQEQWWSQGCQQMLDVLIWGEWGPPHRWGKGGGKGLQWYPPDRMMMLRELNLTEMMVLWEMITVKEKKSWKIAHPHAGILKVDGTYALPIIK